MTSTFEAFTRSESRRNAHIGLGCISAALGLFCFRPSLNALNCLQPSDFQRIPQRFGLFWGLGSSSTIDLRISFRFFRCLPSTLLTLLARQNTDPKAACCGTIGHGLMFWLFPCYWVHVLCNWLCVISMQKWISLDQNHFYGLPAETDCCFNKLFIVSVLECRCLDPSRVILLAEARDASFCVVYTCGRLATIFVFVGWSRWWLSAPHALTRLYVTSLSRRGILRHANANV